jgi:3-oxoacyl-[acyl-carrier protein] reductase
MTDTPNKAALVIGGSGGIGQAVVTRLADDGFAVAVHFAAKAGNAQRVVEEIRRRRGKAISIQADIADAGHVERLFKETVRALGRLDVVVNAAGIMPLSPIARLDLDTFDRVIAVNLRGAFLVLGQAAQYLPEGGRIIAFSSSVIGKALSSYGPYIAAKAGVEGLVHVLAGELRGRSITVNAVAPGTVATELFLRDKSDAQIEQLRKAAPLERLGQPQDIAAVVSFLAGPGGAWVNNQIIRVNGGFA